MATTLLGALLQLQSVERQIAHVRRRLETRKRAVTAQERKIGELREQLEAQEQQSLDKRKLADGAELDLKVKEEQVSKLRTALNTAKTNKEYSSLLTQINTIKADNAKLEETTLREMQDVDALKEEIARTRSLIESEDKRLAEVNRNSAEEIARLEAMLEGLVAKRAEAAGSVPDEFLSIFERIAENYDGEAMAVIEVHGKEPRQQYTCGGCYMSLNAEHVNALNSRDEMRRCDNCGRILYLERMVEGLPAT